MRAETNEKANKHRTIVNSTPKRKQSVSEKLMTKLTNHKQEEASKIMNATKENEAPVTNLVQGR